MLMTFTLLTHLLSSRFSIRFIHAFRFVEATYTAAGYATGPGSRKEYLFLHAAPKGHPVTRSMAAGPPVGYGTRGFKRIVEAPEAAPESAPVPSAMATMPSRPFSVLGEVAIHK